MLKRATNIPGIILACLVLAGCAGAGLEPARDFNDQVAYALGVHTAVLETATRALQAQELTVSEAEDVADLADSARDLIDASRRVHDAGDVDEGQRRLNQALVILQELQAYIRGRQ